MDKKAGGCHCADQQSNAADGDDDDDGEEDEEEGESLRGQLDVQWQCPSIHRTPPVVRIPDTTFPSPHPFPSCYLSNAQNSILGYMFNRRPSRNFIMKGDGAIEAH